MPKTRQVLQRASKEERRIERSALGTLRSQVVAKSTECRYFTAVSRFLAFLIAHRKPYPQTFLRLDQLVVEFLEELWEDGEPKGYASDALSGLGHFIPAVKPHLLASWRLHAAWTRAELPCRAPPFTPLLAYALAQVAFQRGWQDTAVLIILGFHTFARSGELFAARCSDFVLSAQSGSWALPFSKSGQRVGASESLLIEDAFVCSTLQAFLRGKAPGDSLSLVSAGVQRKRLQLMLHDLQVTAPYRWYSLRRGGATHAFRSTNNLPQVCLKGRWSSTKTARIYICEGVAQLSSLQLSSAVHARLRALALSARPSWKRLF